MKRARLSGSRRNAASIRCRLRHSARSVRAVMPCSSRMLLQRQERVEHRRRAALEQPLVAHVEQLVDALEIARRSAIGAVGRGIKPRVQVLQQDRVELAHDLGRPVVALHQLLARALRRRVGAARARARARSAGRTPAGPRAGRRGSAGGRAARRSSAPARDRRAPRRRHQAAARELAPVRPEAAARATQITICRSRRPPGLSLMFGSRLYAAS